MNHAITQEFTFHSLMKFIFPTMIMMMFLSLYTIVDGIFVSRFLGSNSLSSLNIVYPVLSLILAIGIMLATGGSAIIAKKMGENKQHEAYENFSFISLVAVVFGFLFILIGNLFLEEICLLLGANEILLADCKKYLQIMLYFAPITMLQLLYQTFFVTASFPKLGLIVTLLGGFSNMFLDYFFMGVLHMDVSGAALATGIGQSIPAVVGLFFFFRNRHGLHYVLPKWDFHVFLQCCFNGSSEMVSNLSQAFVTFLFNIVMLELLGGPGVAAITIALYAQFLFNGLFFGFSMGVAPVFSYNYGAENIDQIRHIYKICTRFIIISSIVIFVLSIVSTPALVGIFTSKSDITYDITVHGFTIFAFNFLFNGINIFASSLFTAFSNGKISAIISFLRTFVIIDISIIVLPRILGVDGVWLSVVLAEFITSIISIIYLILFKNIYHYN